MLLSASCLLAAAVAATVGWAAAAAPPPGLWHGTGLGEEWLELLQEGLGAKPAKLLCGNSSGGGVLPAAVPPPAAPLPPLQGEQPAAVLLLLVPGACVPGDPWPTVAVVVAAAAVVDAGLVPTIPLCVRIGHKLGSLTR